MFPERRQYAFPLVHHLGWGWGVEAGTALSALTSLGEVAWGRISKQSGLAREELSWQLDAGIN